MFWWLVIVHGFAELYFVWRIRADSHRALVFSFLAVSKANPVRDVFDFHLLSELMTVPESQVDAAFVVWHEAEFDVAKPFAGWIN